MFEGAVLGGRLASYQRELKYDKFASIGDVAEWSKAPHC